MKKMKIVFVVLLMCLSAAMFAEEAEKNDPEVYNNAIGFVFTPSSPMGDYDETLVAGLQYQHWFDNIGLQLTGCMYYDQNHVYSYAGDETGEKLDWKILGGAQFILCTFDVDNLSWIKNDTVFRLYFWLNGGVGCKDYAVDLQNLPYLYAGTGIGLEAVFWKHISIPLEVGYFGQFLNQGGFGICGSTGVRFRF
ncbi:MAG: hypothetical protein KBT02_00660 [Treponema sp.]|nr:hypothetical protein [Candidatus Treponema caballi]